MPLALIGREVELIEARLSRAEDHYREFGRIWDDYLEERPHTLVRESQSDGLVIAKLARTLSIPTELSIEFGELVYELRAALDNAL